MANAFDFELVGDDKASATIIRIEEAIRRLNPQLDKTKEGLKLGGDDSTDSVSKINQVIDGLAKSAKDSVQHIGDIVPPLKMVGELAGKYAGMALKFGAVGAAAYGIGKAVTAVAVGLGRAAEGAYRLDVAAKNAGMRVDDFSRLSGAMQILGTDAQAANGSVEGLFKTFNDALQGRNRDALGLLTQLGVQIEKTKNGTADVMKTFESLAKRFPSLSPETQKTVADMLGLDENTLALLRRAADLKELLAKSDKFGLTMDPTLNDQLSDVNSALNEVSAAWDGLKAKVGNGLFSMLLSDGSVKDGINGVTDTMSHGVDSITMSQVGFGSLFGSPTKREDADVLRKIATDKKFVTSLKPEDQIAVINGKMTDNIKNKYEEWKRPVNAAVQLQQDMYAATHSPIVPGKNAAQQEHLYQLEAKYRLPKGVLDKFYAAESGRGRYMFSPAGAQGPFQFMPATGNDYGLKSRADRMDFTKSSEAAAKYIRDLLKQFDGDVEKAVAAYNWGPGNVNKYGLSRAPKETRDYLGKIMPGLPSNHPVDGGSGKFSPESLFSNGSGVAEISQQIANGVRDGMADNKMQLEVTFINQATGERKTVNSAGPKVSTALKW